MFAIQRVLAVAATFLGGAVVEATLGFDGINTMSSQTFTCLRQNNYQFFIGRIWRSNGQYDATGAQNMKNAAAAGWTNVHGYVFPCLSASCPSATAQIQSTINRMRSENVPGADFLWLDIEIYAWPSNMNTNRQFIRDMISAARAMNVNVGIYSNPNNWNSIVGSTFTELSSLPLWWARYNNAQDLTTGWVNFGGWTRPTIHQFSGDFNGPCSVSMDQNYMA